MAPESSDSHEDSAVPQKNREQSHASAASSKQSTMVSESNNDHEESPVPQNNGDHNQAPPSNVTKVYDPKGDLTLHRLSEVTTFACARCNRKKTSKLVATYKNQWNDLRCNGCYGKLLSEG